MSKKIQVIKYLFFDIIGTITAWFLFIYYRNNISFGKSAAELIQLGPSSKFIIGLILFVLFWIILFSLAGFYSDIFRKSRLKEFGNSLGITLAGSLILFFVLMYFNTPLPSNQYFKLYYILFSLVFIFTYFPRLIITSITIHRIHTRKYGFTTLIIGEGEKALELYNELQAQVKSQGYRIIGYVETSSKSENCIKDIIPSLGNVKSIIKIIRKNDIEEVLLALDSTDNKSMLKLINEILSLHVIIKAIPSLYDYLTGRVKMSEILGAPLFKISLELMPPWEIKVKQLMDYFLSFFALLITSPLILVICLLIRLTSRGPIIHKQERIGQYGKPFTLYKFRSMYLNAEETGPALSSKKDNRVTPLGRFMRKTRLDEIPNFYNVLKGEMSLVGPRPERQFFIDQIINIAPHYIHLQKIKPGITSWGQVKYGYAENVDQMVERLKYDLLYIDNMSLVVDIKIIIYTLITVFRGKGV